MAKGEAAAKKAAPGKKSPKKGGPVDPQLIELEPVPGLTRKQALFALAYLKDPTNATKAAIAAGCPPAGAHVAASRMLKLPKVAAFIAHKTAKVLKPLEISTERILLERARLAFFNPKSLFDEEGKPIPLHQLDDDTAAAIAGLKVRREKTIGDDGEQATLEADVIEYKLADKNASLTALEKINGMYKDEDKGEGALNIVINLN